MTGRKRLVTALVTLLGTALLVLAGALPYGYFVQALWMSLGNELVAALCWALYVFVAVLLWLVVWRLVSLIIRHRPGRGR